MSRAMRDSGIPWIGEIPQEWNIKRFKYAGVFRKGKLPKETNIEGSGLPIIGASEMLGKPYRMFSIDTDIPKCTFSDIIILWDGANAGMVASNLCGIISSTAVAYSCNDKECDSWYLFYLLKGMERYFKDKVFGTTIPHMNMQYIDDIPRLCPSLAEQKAIADFLDEKCAEIDELIAVKQQKIETLKEYKKSIIYEYVTGKREVE